MAWDFGTITSSTPWPALSTKVQNLCGGSGVANWSFVENIPAGTGSGQSGSASWSVDVFKCAGSGTDANDASTDWYIGWAIPSPTTSVTAGTPILAESYDGSAGQKKFKRQAPVGGSGAPVSNGYFNDTYATWNACSKATMWNGITLNTSGFTYAIKMTKNFLLVGLKVDSNQRMGFWGLIDSVTAVSDAIPLVSTSVGATVGGFHRLPSVTTIGSSVGNWTPTFALWTRNGFVGSNSTNDNDFWQNNKVHAARLIVYHGVNSSFSPYSDCGAVRGLVKQQVLRFNQGGTVNLGDTMVIAGNTWTVAAIGGGGDGGWWIVEAN